MGFAEKCRRSIRAESSSTVTPFSCPHRVERKWQPRTCSALWCNARNQRFEGTAKILGLNFATAAACTILGFVYFAVAFAAGESGELVSAGVLVFLLATVISVVALGCWGGWRWSSFAWLAATPYAAIPCHCLFVVPRWGLRASYCGCAFLVFLVGALAGRGLKYWIRVPNRGGPERTGIALTT